MGWNHHNVNREVLQALLMALVLCWGCSQPPKQVSTAEGAQDEPDETEKNPLDAPAEEPVVSEEEQAAVVLDPLKEKMKGLLASQAFMDADDVVAECKDALGTTHAGCVALSDDLQQAALAADKEISDKLGFSVRLKEGGIEGSEQSGEISPFVKLSVTILEKFEGKTLVGSKMSCKTKKGWVHTTLDGSYDLSQLDLNVAFTMPMEYLELELESSPLICELSLGKTDGVKKKKQNYLKTYCLKKENKKLIPTIGSCPK